MGTLKLISLCAYLTDTGVKWRAEDHRATKMVKALKGDSIKGHFHQVIAGKWRRFDQSNINEFLDRIPRALAKHILRHRDAVATIVPIPNSHVTAPHTEGFKTLELANQIAAESNGLLKVEPALVFRTAQQKSRTGGPRDPDHFENAYKIVKKVEGPIVLLDDVCSSGGHLIGAHRLLHDPNKSPVVLACTFGRSTKEQLENPVGLHTEEIELNS